MAKMALQKYVVGDHFKQICCEREGASIQSALLLEKLRGAGTFGMAKSWASEISASHASAPRTASAVHVLR